MNFRYSFIDENKETDVNTHSANSFYSENDGREELRHLRPRRHEVNIVQRLNVTEYIVERDGETDRQARIGDDWKRHKDLQMPDLSEKDYCWNKTKHICSYRNVHASVVVTQLKTKWKP